MWYHKMVNQHLKKNFQNVMARNGHCRGDDHSIFVLIGKYRSGGMLDWPALFDS